MNTLKQKLLGPAFLAACLVCAGTPLDASVLFEVEVHFASGPVSLQVGQTASSCTVNPDSDPISILIALLQADNGNLLTTRQLVLQPGTEGCVHYTRPAPQGNMNLPSLNVYTVVVPNGRIEASGRIVQDRPGSGGCIIGFLQIQTPAFSNAPGQTILYSQMIKHHHAPNDL